MTAKQPQPDFTIRLVGKGIVPWMVPMGMLARVLGSVQRLIDCMQEPEAEEEEGEVELDEPTRLHLIRVKRGSAVYQVAADEREVIEAIAQTGRVIQDPDSDDFNPLILPALERLSQAARNIGCTIEFSRPEKDGEVLATIGPETYGTVAGSAFITGDACIFARIERVGGKTKRGCGLSLADQPQMIHCEVDNEELVRRLGEHVYEYVFVRGSAIWYRRTWRLKTMRIQGFEPPKSGSVQPTLDRVRAAGGYAWDEVPDPEAFVKEMREG